MTATNHPIYETLKARYFKEYQVRASEDNPQPPIRGASLYGMAVVGIMVSALSPLLFAIPAAAVIPIATISAVGFTIIAGALLTSTATAAFKHQKVVQDAAESAFKNDIANRSLIKRFRTDLREQFRATSRLEAEIAGKGAQFQPRNISTGQIEYNPEECLAATRRAAMGLGL